MEHFKHKRILKIEGFSGSVDEKLKKIVSIFHLVFLYFLKVSYAQNGSTLQYLPNKEIIEFPSIFKNLCLLEKKQFHFKFYTAFLMS